MALDLILWLQELDRFWIVDVFFQAVSFLGEEYFYIAVLALVYWLINKRLGEFVGVSLGVTFAFNNLAKDFFQAPRPFEESNLVENKRPGTATGHSMPSGHTQGAASFFAAFAFYIQKRWLLVLAVIVTILMMFSRMYLGVHYLEDVIVGGILGFLTVIVVYVFYNRYKDQEVMLHRFYGILILVFLPFTFFATGNDFFRGYGILVGLVAAVVFEKKYVQFSLSIPWPKKVLRYALGMITLLGVLMGLGALFGIFGFSGTMKNIVDFIRYFLVAFIGFGVYPYIFKRFNF